MQAKKGVKAGTRFAHWARLRRLTNALGCETLRAAGREPSGDVLFQDSLPQKCVKWLDSGEQDRNCVMSCSQPLPMIVEMREQRSHRVVNS